MQRLEVPFKQAIDYVRKSYLAKSSDAEVFGQISVCMEESGREETITCPKIISLVEGSVSKVTRK